jgi:hypothetical protein
MFTYLFIAGSLLAVIALTMLHIPRWLSRGFMRITPDWFQTVVLHVGYGTFIGGVTGHVVSALLSMPWFFISKYWLRPLIVRPRPTTVLS